VLPNAVDLSSFPTHAEAAPQRGYEILFIGQLVHRKGFDLLARAMPLVLREVPQARFVFVSHNRQGEPELRRIVEEAGVTERMELRGRVDEAEKVRLLRTAAVVAAPSRYEGFGIPLIEALAAGAPLVTTDVPAGNEVVEHERTGLLTPYGDVEALAGAIVRLLRDRALAARLGVAGRTAVLGRYEDDRLAADLEQLYRSLKRQEVIR
jgi:glycosyltransferase involved in cell wall biosynthesis